MQFRCSLVSRFVLLLSLALTFSPPTAWAKNSEKSSNGNLLTFHDPLLGNFACKSNGSQRIAGTLKGKKFTSGQKEITKLQKSLAKALKSKNPAKGEKLTQELARKISLLEQQTAFCNQGSHPNSPADPTPELVEDALSLAPLTRTPSVQDVRSLLEKAGFGNSPAETGLFEVALNQGISGVVDEFMRQKSEAPGLLARVEGEILTPTSTPIPKRIRAALIDLWVHTQNPYAEKQALVLLSIWTVSRDLFAPGTNYSAFWAYYQRLRAAAASETDIPNLAVDITRDPLMLHYLDNDQNTKSSPNENYARELMELFTVGPKDPNGNPNYTETQLDGSGDIATAARMLTGWKQRFDPTTGIPRVEFIPRLHSSGPHTMFAGKSYQFTGENDEDLVRGIFLHHPNAKLYYARQLLEEYLTPEPPSELVEAFATVIENNHFQLRPSLATLFKSKAFFHQRYRNTISKNSVEFLVEAIRTLALSDHFNLEAAERSLVSMGMPVNDAPSVFWFPSASWTSPSILLERINFLSLILGDLNLQNSGATPWTLDQVLPKSDSVSTIQAVTDRLGVTNLTTDEQANLDSYMNTIRHQDGSLELHPYDPENEAIRRSKGLGLYLILMNLPSFQLK